MVKFKNSPTITFKGNKVLEERLKKLSETRQIEKGYDVGFFSESTYSDGTKVAQVAIWQEFGTEIKGKVQIPERPFFRIANKKTQSTLSRLLGDFLNLKSNYVLSRQNVEQLALKHVDTIQTEITTLKEPPNALSTIKAKKGSSNPLIDTGNMRRSVTFKVIK